MEAGTELKLYPRRAKYLALAVVSGGFSAIGMLMIRDGHFAGWPCLVLFGLGALVLLIQAVPGASYLKLDERGLTIHSLFRSTSFPWSEIAVIAPGRLGGRPRVLFNLTTESQRKRRLRRFNVRLVGAEAALPDNYGMSAQRLAEVLNEWKHGIRRLDA